MGYGRVQQWQTGGLVGSSLYDCGGAGECGVAGEEGVAEKVCGDGGCWSGEGWRRLDRWRTWGYRGGLMGEDTKCWTLDDVTGCWDATLRVHGNGMQRNRENERGI